MSGSKFKRNLYLLAGCERADSSLKIGYSEVTLRNEKRLGYQTFTGQTSAYFEANTGEDIVLDYDAEVTKGSLTLGLYDPDGGILWDVTLQEDTEDQIEVLAPQSGDYRIRFEGDDTGGGIFMEWEVNE